MELLKKYTKEYESLVDATRELEKNVRDVSTDFELSSVLTKLVDEFCLGIKFLHDCSLDQQAATYFITFQKITNLKTAAGRIVKFIDGRFNKNMKTFVSQTTLGELLREQYELINLFTKTKTRCENLENEIIQSFSSIVISILDDIDVIQKLFRSAPETVHLYKKIMNVLIKINTDEKKNDIVNKILTAIEEDKNWILNRGRDKPQIEEIPMTTFGLIPLHQGQQFSDIVKIYDSSASNIKEFAADLNKKELELIVINRVIEFPVEYNSYFLLNKRVSPNLGVNEKMIDEYKTITIEKNKFRWDFSINHFPSLGHLVVVVVRTSNKFAILSNFIGGSNKLYKAALPKLYEYIKKNPNQKRNNYNSKIINHAKKNMFLDVQYRVDENFGRNFDLRPTINEIYMSILEIFNNSLTAAAAANKLRLREIFVDAKYKQIFIDILTDKFHEHFKKNLFDVNSNDVNVGEVFTTFQFQLNAVSRSFYKELGDKFNTMNAVTTGDILKKFETILMKLLVTLLGGETNIFNAVYQKIEFSKLTMI